MYQPSTCAQVILTSLASHAYLWLIQVGKSWLLPDSSGAVVVEWSDMKALILSSFSPQEKGSFSHCQAYEPALLQNLLQVDDTCF